MELLHLREELHKEVGMHITTPKAQRELGRGGPCWVEAWQTLAQLVTRSNPQSYRSHAHLITRTPDPMHT